MFQIPIYCSDVEELPDVCRYIMHSISNTILLYADIFPVLL